MAQHLNGPDARGLTKNIDWAERLVRSRGIARADPKTGSANGLHLLPLLDMVNHASADDVRVLRQQGKSAAAPALIETEDGVTVLCARTPLVSGDEVTFEYTDDGNKRLLMDYGFAALHPIDGDGESGVDYTYVGLEQLDAMLQGPEVGDVGSRLKL